MTQYRHPYVCIPHDLRTPPTLKNILSSMFISGISPVMRISPDVDPITIKAAICVPSKSTTSSHSHSIHVIPVLAQIILKV